MIAVIISIKNNSGKCVAVFDTETRQLVIKINQDKTVISLSENMLKVVNSTEEKD